MCDSREPEHKVATVSTEFSLQSSLAADREEMRHSQGRNPILNASVVGNASPPNAASGDRVMIASVAERRVMKKVAQPEHAYTGCVPQREEPEIDDLPVKRNPPILGYKGHLRNAQDRIGTTFTNGLEATTRPPEPISLRASNQKEFSGKQPYHDKKEHRQTHHQQVRFQAPPPQAGRHHSPSNRPGNGYAKPQMSPRSKYGAFENASGYGEFQAKPTMSKRSGYGEFDNTSGYGEFQKPLTMSKRSGYGEFENASGYGEFQKPPTMSKRSGYGAFDNASGYGEFLAKPPQMSGRSGYGVFDNASGYGEFQEAPPMSGRSGYGAFEDASGYGEFGAPPPPESVAYGAFEDTSGYGEFIEAPHESQHDSSPLRVPEASNEAGFVLKYSESLDKKYQQAMKAVGGKANALKLWHAAAATISCRHRKRIELLQSIRRSFEKREPENGGKMTKVDLKEVLQSLACVFTDDQVSGAFQYVRELKWTMSYSDTRALYLDEQVTALFGLYDTHCKGTLFTIENGIKNKILTDCYR